MVKVTYLIAYDISKNKTRQKLAEMLEFDLLCTRKNKSVFLGILSKDEIDTLIEIMTPLIKEADSILIFPLCRSCLGRAVEITKRKDDKNTLFL